MDRSHPDAALALPGSSARQSRDGEFILASDDRGQIILQAAP
jgi:hypothetical protein